MTTALPKPRTPEQAKEKLPIRFEQACAAAAHLAFTAKEVRYVEWREGMFVVTSWRTTDGGAFWLARYDEKGEVTP